MLVYQLGELGWTARTLAFQVIDKDQSDALLLRGCNIWIWEITRLGEKKRIKVVSVGAEWWRKGKGLMQKVLVSWIHDPIFGITFFVEPWAVFFFFVSYNFFKYLFSASRACVILKQGCYCSTSSLVWLCTKMEIKLGDENEHKILSLII